MPMFCIKVVTLKAIGRSGNGDRAYLLHRKKRKKTILSPHTFYCMKYLKSLSVAVVASASLFAPLESNAQMNPIKFKEYDLPNGLHVILHQDKSSPVVATVVHYRVGSRDEDPKRTGFAHFFEHLMFEGTKDIPRASIDKYVEEAGGNLNAYTSFDETVYHFELPSNELRLALWIEAQRMRSLVVNTEGVETQRGVVKEERRVRYDNAPYGALQEMLFRYSFADSRYSWTPIGSSQHIDSAAISEFIQFYDKYYQPSNATLVVAGDFEEEDAKKIINEYFGHWPKVEAPKRDDVGIRPIAKEIRETVYDAKAQLPLLVIAYRGPAMTDEDAYAMDMLSDIMSKGESSRLHKALVDKQIAAFAGLGGLNLHKGGLLFLQGASAPGVDIKQVEEKLLAEVDNVIKNGVTEEEFIKARNGQETVFIQSKTDLMGRAMSLAKAYTYAGKTAEVNTEIEKFQKVTRADLQRVAKKYLSTTNRIVLTFMPGTGDEGNTPAKK